MSEPLILTLKKKLEELEQKLDNKQEKIWKSQDCFIMNDGSLTIEELKNANEVIICFNSSATCEGVTIYPREISGKWLNGVIYEGNYKKYSVKINFSTGTIYNAATGYTDLAIDKIIWR